ncbi:hypothetical protein AAVH_19776 [Aphelenchoides avenae]|nr:hypothetical protein AAVH_19776 [Aphelenchus avenae]
MFASTLSQEGYSVQERCDSYLEVKHAKDLRPTGVRFCQNGSPMWTVQSESNEVLVILRTDPDARALPTWVLWYTMVRLNTRGSCAL